jgi:hypothetical protein
MRPEGKRLRRARSVETAANHFFSSFNSRQLRSDSDGATAEPLLTGRLPTRSKWRDRLRTRCFCGFFRQVVRAASRLQTARLQSPSASRLAECGHADIGTARPDASSASPACSFRGGRVEAGMPAADQGRCRVPPLATPRLTVTLNHMGLSNGSVATLRTFDPPRVRTVGPEVFGTPMANAGPLACLSRRISLVKRAILL